ncbi:MAG: helix-turn-helix transcriptional regulator [Sedimentibacter sp.]
MLNNRLLNDPLDFFDDVDEELKFEMELDGILIDLACEIINYRVENNLTQKDLADKLKISQAMVSKVESGDYNPSVEFLFNISKKLGLDLVVELRKSGDYEIEYDCDDKNNIYDILRFAA